MKTLNAFALGYAGAVLSAVSMLLLSLLGLMGIYTGFVDLMIQTHEFFSLSFLGIIGGMIEAAVIGFGLLHILALLYNFFISKSNRT